ncbi:hypothetical protein [Fuchsiella alkaliacetigena]|uniref:hypothetical protein n=1 Tax=Fuchsiella alkaliacetigena TaxID=957042 RepID=UPI00200B55CA|nr:hypothetical protein [Fuchsiella alkaliacetigena]MCK8825873.1 hypothetical protein [Fuchsiella alkaliacetigena]
MTRLKNKNFKIKESTWNEFKKNCEDIGSNASVEIRKFINKYNKKHKKSNFNIDKALEDSAKEHSDILHELAKR